MEQPQARPEQGIGGADRGRRRRWAVAAPSLQADAMGVGRQREVGTVEASEAAVVVAPADDGGHGR
jgi:hypothetical protein